MSRMRITVAGSTGSGKTLISWRIAQMLREEFGIECSIKSYEPDHRPPELKDEYVQYVIENKTLGRAGLTCLIEEQQMSRREAYDK